MDVWKYFEGKKVYIILKNKREYSGVVLEVETNPNSPLVWIVLLDKFGNRVTFVNSEIEVMQEEK